MNDELSIGFVGFGEAEIVVRGKVRAGAGAQSAIAALIIQRAKLELELIIRHQTTRTPGIFAGLDRPSARPLQWDDPKITV